MRNLTDLRLDETAIVKDLTSKISIRRRLQDIGFVGGAKVKKILKSPGKDPMAYLITGTVIALRNEDAKTILIEY